MARSRLERIRGRKAGKQGLIYLVLAIFLIVAMVVWGLPAVARLAGIFVKDEGVEEGYELKPTTPIFADIPEATHSATIKLSGFAQPGVDVSLYVNGAELARKLTTESGTFQFENVPLTEGENRISAYAINSNDLSSEKSKEYAINRDATKPTVTLDSPKDGEVFRGQMSRIANFSGSVSEEGSKVFIGERMVIVQAEGKFTLPYQLVEGDQEIMIKSIDKAGNENTQTIKLRWEP